MAASKRTKDEQYQTANEDSNESIQPKNPTKTANEYSSTSKFGAPPRTPDGGALPPVPPSELTAEFDPRKQLRTLLPVNIQRLRYSDLSKRVLRNILPRLTYLRALLLSCYEIEELPDDLFIKLKLLRFLDLSRTEIKKLPDSICVLYNLETLLLSSCKYLEQLPQQMEKLINLRHLDIKETAAAAEKNKETAATAEQRSRRLISEGTVFIHQLVVNI
ncbi:hypothetical protein T459_28928 [Capsicum annuum]|uniref:Disease resistance R13L4/SHOC-2-like LRR domain-containing protein n=1 Tax=Capsicum annuum TaxID=4072 RepID=A0A2G2YIM2_CAPAN|nr:hypothetical protein T459_28928 [Capsicum annuum]